MGKGRRLQVDAETRRPAGAATPTGQDPFPKANQRKDRWQLQRLRREAGYRSAKDFAAVLGIPASTYTRYERQAEGPECAIPLSSAWQIADALGCSIDLVVGREDIDAASAPTLDDRAAALSLDGQEILRGFLGYLEQLDAAKAAPRRPVL